MLDKRCYINCSVLIAEFHIFDFIKDILENYYSIYFAIDIALYFILYAFNTEDDHDAISEQLSDGVINDEIEELLLNNNDTWIEKYIQLMLNLIGKMTDEQN